MSSVARIDVYSHGIRFSRFGLQFARLLGDFMRVYCLQTTKRRERSGRWVTEALNTFAAARSDYTEIYLLKSQLELFYEYAHTRGLKRTMFEVVENTPKAGVAVKLKKKWPFKFRDDQTEWLDYMNKPTEFRYHLNTAGTGVGKTAMCLETIYRSTTRAAVVLSPKYMKGWHGAIKGFFDFEVGEIIEICGTNPKKPPDPMIPRYSMEEFQAAVEEGLEFKIVLISINLMQRYISEYERTNSIGPYAFKPGEFYEKCGIGMLVHDEAHEWLHFLFKMQCYAFVPEILYLSATVESDDNFVEGIYRYMFPIHGRFHGGEWDKYINSTAVTYALRSTDKIRYKGFGGAYSHTEFEKSIMKHKQLKKAYFDFIFKVAAKAFLGPHIEGQKMLIYCATVDMCNALADYLTERIPTLQIGPYTQEQDFSMLLENDVSVTTVKSAGTGVDIPDLVFTFMTLAMGSRQGNIQVLGRLRKLKGEFEGLTPNFYYLVCRDIEAHRKYHHKKVENFSDKVLTQRILDMDFEL